ncbi:hypothetical protein D9619_000875 [Psilocybe cf. subviscida]|uniref:6-methylsalicylate decarboxylase n=1 Tax=Psilocybe cf. subviscida TaxID=2480587 RepID=A0A8H5BEG4_9AGAR|nr:hypothetical protein D9619_000875 [Psilocybe cf. subviscida]
MGIGTVRTPSPMSTSLAPPNVLLNQNCRRIDVHHHYFPPDLDKLKSNADVGWRTPSENLPWSPSISLQAMDAMSIDVALLSYPPISSGSCSEENRALARERNQYAAAICRQYPDRFGFFVTLPFLDDVEGVLQEISHGFDELYAHGVSLASSCGIGAAAKYVGDALYEPIWAELDRRKAVVFLHGSQTPSSTPYPHPFLGIPITEAPNETFKAAAHLVVSGNRRKFPHVKIILAHLGGTTPMLAARVAVLSSYMGCSLSPEEILEDFRTFYYESALSAHGPTLDAMRAFVDEDHVMFGTDFPAVSTQMANWFTDNLEKYYTDEKRLKGVMSENAKKLFLGVDK